MTWFSGWRLRRHWPVVVLGLLILLFSTMLLFSRKAPVIAAIEPPMAAPGETVTLTGEYFGRTAREGQLTLGGITPPPSLIREWTDQQIIFQVPEDAPSGLVTVANSQGVSDSVLFTNTLTIPTVLKTRVVQTSLEVTSIVPSVPVPGQTVILNGRGFGHGEEGSWLDLHASGESSEPIAARFPPSETLKWTDQQISFLLPPGWGLAAVISVHTTRGDSPAIPLQSLGPVVFDSAHEVSLDWSYTVTIEGGRGVVKLVPTAPDPRLGTQWSDEGGDPLVFVNPSAGVLKGTRRLNVLTVAKLWNGFSSGQIIPDEVQQPPEGTSAVPAPWKPVQTAVKALSARWNLDSPDPVVKVRKAIDSLRSAFRQGGTLSGKAELALTPAAVSPGSSLSPLTASVVTALLVRQGGLSSRLVYGLLLGPTEVRAHVWLQIWIPGAAWVDFDPWLLLNAEADWEKTFGSFDGNHIAWTLNGETVGRQLPQSRAVQGLSIFSLPALMAETTGDLAISAPVWQVRTTLGVKGR